LNPDSGPGNDILVGIIVVLALLVLCAAALGVFISWAGSLASPEDMPPVNTTTLERGHAECSLIGRDECATSSAPVAVT